MDADEDITACMHVATAARKGSAGLGYICRPAMGDWPAQLRPTSFLAGTLNQPKREGRSGRCMKGSGRARQPVRQTPLFEMAWSREDSQP